MNQFFKHCFSLLFIIWFSTSIYAQDTTQVIFEGRTNSKEQQAKPYVILISADGFRYDLADKYNAVFLKKMRDSGVSAESMKPSYPTLTFPNHYTIVTGLYPSHHGIVGNSFYGDNGKLKYTYTNPKSAGNGAWYGGLPLWVLAEQQKMISASFYWVGSEADIQGVRPTYYYRYNERIPITRRIQVIKQWLQLPEDKRPHFITVYFPQVDHEEHSHGTESDSVREAVQLVDQAIELLTQTIDSLNLPVNYVFLSDHGMINTDYQNPILLPQALDTTLFNMAVSGTIVQLYARKKSDIKPTYKKLKAEAKGYTPYLKKHMPAKWHYGKKDDCFKRIGDIVLVPDAGKVFNFFGRRSAKGDHGYDNDLKEMQATFYAWGPAFKQHLKIASFENIHVYPLISHILGLKQTCPIDGDFNVLKATLK